MSHLAGSSLAAPAYPLSRRCSWALKNWTWAPSWTCSADPLPRACSPDSTTRRTWPGPSSPAQVRRPGSWALGARPPCRPGGGRAEAFSPFPSGCSGSVLVSPAVPGGVWQPCPPRASPPAETPPPPADLSPAWTLARMPSSLGRPSRCPSQEGSGFSLGTRVLAPAPPPSSRATALRRQGPWDYPRLAVLPGLGTSHTPAPAVCVAASARKRGRVEMGGCLPSTAPGAPGRTSFPSEEL